MLRTLLCCTAVAVAAPLGFGAGPRPLLLPPAPASDDCAFQAERSARVDAAGASLLDLVHESGSLVVEGRPGLREVRIRATACASHRAYLDDLQVRAERGGDAVRVSGAYPRIDGWGGDEERYARLDMVVEVPAGMPTAVEDGSGAMELSGLGALLVDDGSGPITLRDIRGPVEVEDGSGEVVMEGVTGDIVLDDGSGSEAIARVEGSVEVDDGSGELTVTGVTGSVIVRDGSGGIEVRDVGRDFRVLEDGSGGIRHSGVRGTVEVPPQRRGTRRH